MNQSESEIVCESQRELERAREIQREPERKLPTCQSIFSKIIEKGRLKTVTLFQDNKERTNQIVNLFPDNKPY